MTPSDLEHKAEQLVESNTVRLPEYGAKTPDVELLRLSSALERLGFAFYWPRQDAPARAVPKAVVEEATALRRRAMEERRVRAAIDAALSVETFAQQLRAEADEILAQRGVAIKAKIAAAVSEFEAA